MLGLLLYMIIYTGLDKSFVPPTIDPLDFTHRFHLDFIHLLLFEKANKHLVTFTHSVFPWLVDV